MKRILIMMATLLCLGAPVASLAGAAAYNPLDQACKSGTNTSSACDKSVNGSDPISGSNGILRKVENIIAILAGVAAVIVIIIAGFRYITSAGDPQKASSARSMLIGAVIGLIIIATAQTILVFVLSRV